MRIAKATLALIIAVTVGAACTDNGAQPACVTRQYDGGRSYEACPSTNAGPPGGTLCYPDGDMMSCCFDPDYEYTTAAGYQKSICEGRIRAYCSAAEPADLSGSVDMGEIDATPLDEGID